MEDETTQTTEQATPEPEQAKEETLEVEQTPPEAPAEALAEQADKEKLIADVKANLLACSEDVKCLDTMLARFEQVAQRLGVPTEKLIDEIFSLLK